MYKQLTTAIFFFLAYSGYSQTGDSWEDAHSVIHGAWEETFTNQGLTYQLPVGGCSEINSGWENRWFKFTPTSTFIRIIFTNISTERTEISLWETNNSSLILLKCGNNGTVGNAQIDYEALETEKLYHFSVATRVGGNYRVSVANQKNDDYWEGALAIPHTGYWEETLTNEGYSYTTPVGGCSEISTSWETRWFKFSPTSTYARVLFQNIDTERAEISLWELGQDILIPLGCSNNGVSGSAQIDYEILDAQKEYFICVGARIGGHYKLSISNQKNDDYWEGALAVPHSNHWEETFNNEGYYYRIPVGDCSEISPSWENRWFTFKPTSGQIQLYFTNIGTERSEISLWERNGNVLTLLACQNNQINSDAELEYTSLQSSKEYYISVSTRISGDYKITIQGGAFPSIWTLTNTFIQPADLNNKIAIGFETVPSEYMMAINGKAIMEGVKVQRQEHWPDYVFDAGYPMKSLSEVEAFVIEHKHLPEIPNKAEVDEVGLDLGQMNSLLLKKIEELTLYIIEQNKKIETLEIRLNHIEQKAH